MDSRRYLSTFAVFALVLLRLVIGWHFFGEGGEKLKYNRHNGQWQMVFSADDFLSQAQGPLAKFFRSQAPDDHGFRDLLVVGQENVPPTSEQIAERSQWQAEYNRRRADAEKTDDEVPVEFPPSAPYRDWAERIATDWRTIRDDVKAVPGLTDEQRERADQALARRLQQLADYLASEASAIAEYRHELWRLAKWRSAPEAGDVPFHDERITTKAAETKSPPMAWVNQVREIKAAYRDDLSEILTAEQHDTETIAAAFDKALSDSQEESLRIVNLAVTALVLGVGICLLLGFFTRLASIAGALFLLSVIATQPPWLAEARETMPYCIEFAGLLVLAGTGAGRWMGLDYFTWALFHRRREAEV
jgi:uncharacterized membrane protein YphA (DoxX/SURF4 family)